MSVPSEEISRRQSVAMAAIREVFGTEEDEAGATLFVSHHLEEIDAAYWEKHLETAAPEPSQVLDLLVLRSHWGDGEQDEDGIDTFDFTLPEEVTDYVISVHFDEEEAVDDISMES